MTVPTEALVLLSPLDGWATPLDELPDPVFATRMLGDGVAIDPTSNVVRAPCDGEVTVLPASRHAVTLRTSHGVEVLVHVGIDTVALGGEGFEALVAVGARVSAGDPLLRFDLDLLAQRAPSLLTPVIVLGDASQVESRICGESVRAGQPIATVSLPESSGSVNRLESAPEMSSGCGRAALVLLAHGLHARPAARIVHAAGKSGGRVTITRDGNVANALSVTSLLALGVRHGDKVLLAGDGPDARAALDSIAAILAAPETEVPAAARPAPERVLATAMKPADNTDVVHAVVASRGLALGPVHRLHAATFDVPVTGRGALTEAASLHDALHTVRGRLGQQAEGLDTAHRDIAAAHVLLLGDPELHAAAEHLIEQGSSAGHAWREATRSMIATLERLDDPYLRERAADLRDLQEQVLVALGLARADVQATRPPDGAIVLAADLLPSQFAALDVLRLGGVCTSGGGPTSHVAILAAATGLPMLVAAGQAIADVPDGRIVLLDANAGTLHLDPDAALRTRATGEIAGARAIRERQREAARSDARTSDGARVLVYANLGAPEEATRAVELGAEGCGLLRSEFLFLDRRTAPDEAEQRAVYADVAARLEGRTLTIRTLDVGGDKPLAYLPMPAEDNPALGLRGVRTSLHRPELLHEQLRAILGVLPAGQCRILLPMITDVAEIEIVRKTLHVCAAELGQSQLPELGVMIETPAAAVLADTLAVHADFFSIGTNDLTQYTLAMDRTHPNLAARLDGLHPAVLRLVRTVCDHARPRGREVAVCGGLAMDEAAIPVLLGLGVHELSVAPAAIPAVKARVASLELDACRDLARRALACATAAEVRALVAHEASTFAPVTP